MKYATVLAMSLSVASLCGCVSRSWNGEVEMWGTLRGVLRDGDTAGKIRLSEATRPHCVGIGAPEGLAGEIVVIDGESWVAKADPQGRMETQHPAAPETMATFLAVATVPMWFDQPTKIELSLDELEEAVRVAAENSGLDTTSPFPFIVEGRFTAINLHILNGRCPFAQPNGDDDPAHDPIRIQTNDAQGVLVGFFHDGPPGILTHAGTKLHVHALLKDEQHTVGHVDALSVAAGAVIRVPAIR